MQNEIVASRIASNSNTVITNTRSGDTQSKRPKFNLDLDVVRTLQNSAMKHHGERSDFHQEHDLLESTPPRSLSRLRHQLQQQISSTAKSKKVPASQYQSPLSRKNLSHRSGDQRSQQRSFSSIKKLSQSIKQLAEPSIPVQNKEVPDLLVTGSNQPQAFPQEEIPLRTLNTTREQPTAEYGKKFIIKTKSRLIKQQQQKKQATKAQIAAEASIKQTQITQLTAEVVEGINSKIRNLDASSMILHSSLQPGMLSSKEPYPPEMAVSEAVAAERQFINKSSERYTGNLKTAGGSVFQYYSKPFQQSPASYRNPSSTLQGRFKQTLPSQKSQKQLIEKGEVTKGYCLPQTISYEGTPAHRSTWLTERFNHLAKTQKQQKKECKELQERIKMISKENKDRMGETYNLKGRQIPLATTANLQGRTSPHLSDLEAGNIEEKKSLESGFRMIHTGPSGRGPINHAEQLLQLKSTYGRKQMILDPSTLKTSGRNTDRVRLPTEVGTVKAITRQISKLCHQPHSLLDVNKSEMAKTLPRRNLQNYQGQQAPGKLSERKTLNRSRDDRPFEAQLSTQQKQVLKGPKPVASGVHQPHANKRDLEERHSSARHSNHAVQHQKISDIYEKISQQLNFRQQSQPRTRGLMSGRRPGKTQEGSYRQTSNPFASQPGLRNSNCESDSLLGMGVIGSPPKKSFATEANHDIQSTVHKRKSSNSFADLGGIKPNQMTFYKQGADERHSSSYGGLLAPTEDDGVTSEEQQLIHRIQKLKESQQRNILSHLKFQSYIEQKQSQIDRIYSSNKMSSPKNHKSKASQPKNPKPTRDSSKPRQPPPQLQGVGPVLEIIQHTPEKSEASRLALTPPPVSNSASKITNQNQSSILTPAALTDDVTELGENLVTQFQLIENPGVGGMTKITYHPPEANKQPSPKPEFCKSCQPGVFKLEGQLAKQEQGSSLHSWQVLLSTQASPVQSFHLTQADMIVNFQMGAPLLVIEIFKPNGDSPTKKNSSIVRKTLLGNQFQAIATGKQQLSHNVSKNTCVAFCIFEHLLTSFETRRSPSQMSSGKKTPTPGGPTSPPEAYSVISIASSRPEPSEALSEKDLKKLGIIIPKDFQFLLSKE